MVAFDGRAGTQRYDVFTPLRAAPRNSLRRAGTRGADQALCGDSLAREAAGEHPDRRGSGCVCKRMQVFGDLTAEGFINQGLMPAPVRRLSTSRTSPQEPSTPSAVLCRHRCPRTRSPPSPTTSPVGPPRQCVQYQGRDRGRASSVRVSICPLCTITFQQHALSCRPFRGPPAARGPSRAAPALSGAVGCFVVEVDADIDAASTQLAGGGCS